QDEHSRPRRFAGIGRKVSLFFITAVLGVAGVILLVSYKQGAFVRHTSIYFYAADVFGINKGMAVKLFGLPVGSVTSMDISDRGVKVELSIVSDYIPRIPKGSQARLVREGYIGAANIQIIPGVDSNRGTAPVAEKEVIEFVRSRDVAELFDDLKKQVTPMFNDVSRTIAEMNRPDSDFRKSMAAARATLEKLPDTGRDAGKLLRDADTTMLAVGRDAGTALGSAARVGAQAEQQLPVLSGKLSTTLDTLSEAAVQIRDAARKNGDALHEVLTQVPALLRDGGDLVRDGQEIVGATRNAWPIRDLVEAPAMRTLPVDSFEWSGAGRPVADPAQR
ncbi:MAG: MlaD family protein, partial [Burkholderiales bacterium]